MGTFHTGLLIRALIVLVTLCLLVIGGVLVARGEKRRASSPANDASTNSGARPAAMEGSLRYPADRRRLEANDRDASAPGIQRRAA